MPDEARRLLAEVRTRSYRHVVFDFDGTLVLMDLPWKDWIDQVASALPPARRLWFRGQFATPGSPWGLAVNDLIQSDDLDLTDYLSICREFESPEFPYQINDELVAALHLLGEASVTLSLWSNNSHAGVGRVLDQLGIAELFTGVVTRDDIRLGKPDPEGWRLLDRAAPAGSCLLVGDSENDRLAARNAGISYFEVTRFR